MGEYASKDYWFYLRVVLGYNFLDPWDHGEEMVWFLEANLGSPMFFVVPRGGCKSAVVTIPFHPWAIGRDPTYRGIIANVRDPKARAFGAQAAAIMTSPRYQACFPWVRPGKKWGEEGYFTAALEAEQVDELGEFDDLSAVEGRVEPSIGMVGVGGNITSAHVRGIIFDDLVNIATYQSDVEKVAAVSLIDESYNCLDPDGQMIGVCTRWGPDDAYEDYISNVKPGPNGSWKIFKRGARDTRFVFDVGANQVVNDIYNPKRPFVDANGKRKWVGFSAEFLDAVKKAHGDLYYALFEGEPIGDANKRFSPELIRGFQVPPFELSSEVRVGIEAGGVQNAMYSAFIKKMRDENRAFGLMKFIPPRRGDKETHIEAALGHLIREERFYCQEDFWRMSGIEKEFKDFPLGKSDDLLDAIKWASLKAPRHQPEMPPIPIIAIDPAFTAEKQSNYTAIVVACWHNNDFYILEGKKFKTQETDLVIREVFKLYDKYSRGGKALSQPKRPGFNLQSPGNEVRRAKKPDKREVQVWGTGIYAPYYLKEKLEHERKQSADVQVGGDEDSGAFELEED